ncbi:LmbE family N-acetylglucosaminyl deacetylase [Actinoplanes lutulentus]|uniref:LmbE family N-acetylglucosaminyl deacetylase n=1 Tax=Actinoplanes lutulentus TaxID=1287878 RepID=A0A327YYH3_9ACTN|nr:PIG-L family deacetylase [Actinoplanes lutulentus]MBB2940410.1 LmbE family N-acetylglucosaminyl deacetylase [Actinoplanes lutulentus]RAK25857.1 LmbE family N-acetylglucosaminyl deacetylase [Actinoplanes lutulentus]
MSDRPLTLLAVHAHPDDEVTSTGGVLAKYAAQGVTTIVVTCTDGRCGDGPNGVKPGDPGHDPEAVVATRRRELEASCAALKVSHLETLGYHDSGMMGWDTNDAPGSFWATPVDVAAQRLAALIEKYQPDVVLTYDENGGYGHPDHIQVHRVTMAAVELAKPAKVYMSAMPRSMMVKVGERMREMGIGLDGPAAEDAPPMGWEDEDITTRIDVSDVIDQKFDALSAHASQGDGAFFLSLGRETFSLVMGVESFVKVGDSADGNETDLFN